MPSNMRYRRSTCRTGPSRRRRAVAVLELVLVIPILILPVLAIVRFGLYYANLQQVTLASRIGAEEAAETENLSSLSPGSDSVPGNVRDAIGHQLATAGIKKYRVRLEHRGKINTVVLSASQGGWDEEVSCGPSANLSEPLLREYVRLTICVPVSELVPRYTDVFGLGIWANAEVVECTTVFRYEESP